MKQQDNSLWQVIKGYFNALPDKENEAETIRQISAGITFHGANLWILVFAIFIASLGLNTNSTAVIIGAMLISPLMGPILGMGLSVGINDFDLLKRSVKNYLVATVISVLTATIYFSITPLNEAQSELLARTSPSLYDVLIALFGGAAGILALCTKGKGNVIPGVAIATALMPPLCTAGYGLAVGKMSFFLGAFYLFFINTVFIALSTFVGVRMLRFKHREFLDAQRLLTVRRYMIAVVVITMLPATYMTVQIIRQSMLDNSVKKFVKNEISFKGTQVISQNRDDERKTLNVVVVGRPIGRAMIDSITGRLSQYRLTGYRLNVIQGYDSDSLLIQGGGREMTAAGMMSEAVSKQLLEQSSQIYELESQLQKYTAYEKLGREVAREVKAVCPLVQRIALSNMEEVQTDTAAARHYVVAVLGCSKPLPKEDRVRIENWLKVRTKVDSLRVITTH